MQVLKTDFVGSDFMLERLLELGPKRKAALEVGTVEFAAGYRHPQDGMSVHSQDEISLILSGRLVVEHPSGNAELGAGDVVFIPAGEPHASRALEQSRVYFVLFGLAEDNLPAGTGIASK